MMYTYKVTKEFKKAVKLCIKRGYPMNELKTVIDLLVDNGKLPDTYRPHKLHGNKEGLWECHIKADWLLIWQQNDTEMTLLMVSTGTHSDLLSK